MPTASAPPDAPLRLAAEELGDLLREAREAAGLKLSAAASRAGTSSTTLSLLERGKRAVPAALLERVASVSGADPSEVFRLAGTVPPQALAEFLGRDLRGVLAGAGLSAAARRALRSVHLLALATRVSPDGGMPPVDPEDLLDREFGIEVRAADVDRARFATHELVEYNARLDKGGRRDQRNVVLGHMAGHALLAREASRRPACSHAAGGALEAEATWLAGLVLMPRNMLESEAHVLSGTYDVNTRDGLASFIADVASAFGVPVWLAARHLAAAGLLAWAAGEEEP
jgi:transcriptional regulator with XRE-family HTH domain